MNNKKIALDAKSRKLMMRETTTSYLFLLPFLLFFLVFVVYPMFMCVYTSFFDATIGREDIFVGMQNYRDLLWKQNINPDGSISYGVYNFDSSNITLRIACFVRE